LANSRILNVAFPDARRQPVEEMRCHMARSLLKSAAVIVALTACAAPLRAQEITLMLTDHNAASSLIETRGVMPWVRKVEEATKGRVKIRVFPSQTLAKGPDAWKSVKAGVADLCWCFHGYWADMTPLSDVITLPTLPFSTAEKGSEVFWKLYEKYPSIQREYADVKPLLLFTTEPYILITTKKQVKTMEDLKGLKIRVAGGPPTEQIKALGGVPMLVPMPDNYVALDNGVLDGMGASWESIHGWRFYEVVKNYTIVPLSAVYFSLSMNKAKWNSLPKDIQDAIMSVSGLEGSKTFARDTYDVARDMTVDLIKTSKPDANIYTIPPEELERWSKSAGEPLWQHWVKKMEAKRHPEAKQILADALELLQRK
jgi:TRAP-type C4-dicarboxylate transport system substrate-binding protein